MSNLFIPKTIKVGYQKRKDTYTGKLAFVVYYDAQNKLRKEYSWNHWRDSNIEPEEFDNTPTDYFVLNKEVQRYNWSHFNSNRSYIRIHDPRGIEFEITPENLIGLLMETNCNKRMIDGKCVYAWQGTELVLLPCSSEAYKHAVEHTDRQSKRVSARDLKQGCVYTKKDGSEITYMGRSPWWRWYPTGEDKPGRVMKKKHIFLVGEDFEELSSMNSLSYCNSEEPVQNYASLVQKLEKDLRTNEIDSFKLEGTAQIKEDQVSNSLYNATSFYGLEEFSKYITSYSVRYRYNRGDYKTYEIYVQNFLDPLTLKVLEEAYYNSSNVRVFGTLEEVNQFIKDYSSKVYAVDKSGKKYKLDCIRSWGMPGQK